MIGNFQNRFGPHFGMFQIRFRRNEIGWCLSGFHKVIGHVMFIVPQSNVQIGQQFPFGQKYGW